MNKPVLGDFCNPHKKYFLQCKTVNVVIALG